MEDVIFGNVTLMVKRRGYSEIILGRDNLKDVGEFSIYRNPENVEHITVYLIKYAEKVSIKKIREIIKHSLEKRVILIHDMPFTPDSKHTIQVNNVFIFEVFTYEEMMYDPLSIIDNPYKLYTGPPLKEINKLPKISDIITKYMAFPVGSIVQVDDYRTGIPCLYVVLKVIGDELRKK